MKDNTREAIVNSITAAVVGCCVCMALYAVVIA